MLFGKRQRTLSTLVLPLLLGAGYASASIVGSTGPVVMIAAPTSVVPGASVNTTDGQVFTEVQNDTLAANLSVDATNPGTYSNGGGVGGTIAAGTAVNSYFVLFDSGGAGVTYPTVTLTFSTPILGVIFTDANLNASDAILGNPGTTYPTGVAARGQEGGDSTAISASGFTVTLNDTTSSPGDDIRIITAAAPAVPEPATWSLCGAAGALLFGWLVKRRHS